MVVTDSLTFGVDTVYKTGQDEKKKIAKSPQKVNMRVKSTDLPFMWKICKLTYFYTTHVCSNFGSNYHHWLDFGRDLEGKVWRDFVPPILLPFWLLAPILAHPLSPWLIWFWDGFEGLVGFCCTVTPWWAGLKAKVMLSSDSDSKDQILLKKTFKLVFNLLRNSQGGILQNLENIKNHQKISWDKIFDSRF